jgi:MFS family permease
LSFPYLAIQGIGGGTILNLSDIIISDLVPLSERGIYEGLLGLTWAFASGVGPPIVRFLLSVRVYSFIFAFRGVYSPKKYLGDGYSVRVVVCLFISLILF